MCWHPLPASPSPPRRHGGRCCCVVASPALVSHVVAVASPWASQIWSLCSLFPNPSLFLVAHSLPPLPKIAADVQPQVVCAVVFWCNHCIALIVTQWFKAFYPREPKRFIVKKWNQAWHKSIFVYVCTKYRAHAFHLDHLMVLFQSKYYKSVINST